MDSPGTNKRKMILDLNLSAEETSSSLPLRFIPRSLSLGSVSSASSLGGTAAPSTVNTTAQCTTTFTSSGGDLPAVIRIPEVAPEGPVRRYRFLPRRPLWSLPPPGADENYKSEILELLEMKLDPYLCAMIYEYLSLFDLWRLAQTTRQRMVCFRVAMLGGVTAAIPDALQNVYMYKLGSELDHPIQVALRWTVADKHSYTCHGCELRHDGMDKVRLRDKDMKIHYLPGCEGSVYIHGSVRRERPLQVEFNPHCLALAYRRSIMVSLEVLRVSDYWMGLSYKDLKDKIDLIPRLQEVVQYVRPPTRLLEVQARKLARYCVRNRKA